MLLLTIDENMQSSSFLIRLNKRFQYFFQTVSFLEYALALLTFCTWTENPWRGSFCSLAPLPWAIWQLAAAATARPQAASLVWPPALRPLQSPQRVTAGRAALRKYAVPLGGRFSARLESVHGHGRVNPDSVSTPQCSFMGMLYTGMARDTARLGRRSDAFHAKDCEGCCSSD